MSKSPAHLSLSLLADRCASLRQLFQVHALMIVAGRIPADNFAASRLLVSYAISPHQNLSLALALFSRTPNPNSFMFNTLIRAFASSTYPHRSFDLFARMRSSSVPAGKHTFPFLLRAAAGLRSSPLSQQMHNLVFKHGLDANVYVANGLMHSYGCCRSVSDARKVFNETTERNPMIWTTMVSGYVKNRLPDEAIWLFEEMVGSGVQPCGATLASVLSACARVGGLETGRWVHGLVREKGVEVGVILGTALVDMYAKNGAVLEAREVFDGMPERNTATWNAMICGSAHHGHCDGALRLFQELEATKEVGPNDITFTGILTACCNGGWVKLGREIFRSMEERYGVDPKVEHYGCMVDLFGRNGRLEEAEELVRGMKWKTDVVVWGALLAASHNYGKIEIAERVVEEMLKLEPENHGVYVVLSNMYAEVGRWEDVERLRSVMRGRGLKKIPGCSSMHGHGH